MRKQELVHVHGLLAELRNEYDRRVEQPSQCERYDRLEVRPTSVHRTKCEHERAVLALATELASAIEENGDRTPAAGRTDRVGV